jgi:hypothetical protein
MRQISKGVEDLNWEVSTDSEVGVWKKEAR